MNDKTKELAERAGFGLSAWKKICTRHSNGSFVEIEDELERFAELIRQDEREANAKLCDEFIGEDHYDMFGNDLAEQCSTAIRQREEQP